MGVNSCIVSVFVCVLWIVASCAAGPAAPQGPCCGDLGCFSPSGDFASTAARPINSVPDCTLTSRLYLRLNTQRNPLLTQLITPYLPGTIRDSNFDPTKPTKVLMHGFLDRYTRPNWRPTMVTKPLETICLLITDNFLQDGDYNIVRVDWSQGNVPPYIQAVANLRLVGAYLAKFLHVLVAEIKVNPKDIHLIGHSLGAHGSGYAGFVMRAQHNTTIGRITGLDPAGPYFTNMPTSVRLDSTDAEFVDTIVTNGDILDAFGSPQSMGHINFFPNGGMNQPGCSVPTANVLFNTQAALSAASLGIDGAPAVSQTIQPSTSFDRLAGVVITDSSNMVSPQKQSGSPTSYMPSLQGLTSAITSQFHWNDDALDIVGCSHSRAVQLFADTILRNSCIIIGNQCDSYDLFLNPDGGCTECVNRTTCTRMGYYTNASIAAPNRIKRFYTVTMENTPYCSNFKIQFKLKAASSSETDNDVAMGAVYFTIFGTGGETEKMLVSKPEYISLVPGKTYYFYPDVPANIGKIQTLTLFWKPKSSGGLLRSLIRSSVDYIFLDGDITVTDHSGLTQVFTPAKSKVPSGADVNARIVRQYKA